MLTSCLWIDTLLDSPNHSCSVRLYILYIYSVGSNGKSIEKIVNQIYSAQLKSWLWNIGTSIETFASYFLHTYHWSHGFATANAQIWAVFLFPFAPGGTTCVKICRWLYPKTHACFVPMNDWQWNNKSSSLNKAWAFLKTRVCPLSVAIVKTLFGGFSQNSKQKLKYSISYILVNLSLFLFLQSLSLVTWAPGREMKPEITTKEKKLTQWKVTNAFRSQVKTKAVDRIAEFGKQNSK